MFTTFRFGLNFMPACCKTCAKIYNQWRSHLKKSYWFKQTNAKKPYLQMNVLFAF